MAGREPSEKQGWRWSRKFTRGHQKRVKEINIIPDEDMDEHWHSSLALGPMDVPQTQPPPIAKDPSPPSPASSTFDQDLSDEEDHDIMSLLQVMPDLSSPGGMLAAQSKSQAHARDQQVHGHQHSGWISFRQLPEPIRAGHAPLHPRTVFFEGHARPSTAPVSGSSMVQGGPRPATASQHQACGEPYRNTCKRHSLLRLARLSHQLGESMPEQSMMRAMLAAGRVGAESLDPYAPLRCPIEQYSAQPCSRVHGAAAAAQQSMTGGAVGAGTAHGPVRLSAAAPRMADTLGMTGATSLGALGQQPHQQSSHQPPTAAQHLESMLPWNRNPYLRGVRAKMNPSLPPSQYGFMQDVNEMDSFWDDSEPDPLARLRRSIGHVNFNKMRKQEPSPRPDTNRGRTRAKPEVEVPSARPATAAPIVRTEVFQSTPLTFVAADPYALTNARMVSDMLDKQPTPEDPKKKKRSARRPAKSGQKPPGATQDAASEEAQAAARKALFLKKRNDPAPADSFRASGRSASRRLSLADIEASKLEQRLNFVQAKQAAIASAYLNNAPLKAKAARPSSAMVASSLPFHQPCLLPSRTLSAGHRTPGTYHQSTQSGASAWTASAPQSSTAAGALGHGLSEQQAPSTLSPSNKPIGAEAAPLQHPGEKNASTPQAVGDVGMRRRLSKAGTAGTGVWRADTANKGTALAAWRAGGAGHREAAREVDRADAPTGWSQHGPDTWAVVGDAAETRDALNLETQEAVRAVNPMPVEAASPVAQAMARLQPGAPRDAEVLSSFYPKPSSAAVAMASVSLQSPGHGPRPGSAVPVEGVASISRPEGFNKQGVKAAVESDMFVSEAYEHRKKGAFEHLGEVGRILRRYQQQPDLTTLQLSHCIRSIDQVGALADMLVQMPELEVLLLGGNDLNDEAFKLLGAQNVLSSPGAASITSLDLSGNRLGPNSVKLLLPLLRHGYAPEVPTPHTLGGSGSNLQVRHELDTREDLGSQDPQAQQPAAHQAPSSMHTPAAGPSSVSGAGAAAAAPIGPGGDKELDLPKDPGEFSSWRVAKAMPPEDAIELVPPQGTLAEVAKWWRQRTLRMFRSGKSLAGLPSMKLGVFSPLRGAQLSVLDLSGNAGIKDIGLELLATVMQGTPVGLQVLRVSQCGLGERSAVALGKALSNASPLEELDISWNRLGLGGARALAAGIRESKELAILKLNHTGLGDMGSAHIAHALQTNTSLRMLDISSNGVASDTGMVLSASLKIHRTLRCLVLRDNPLGFVAARRLLQVVHISALHHLDLLGCSFYKVNMGASKDVSPLGSAAVTPLMKLRDVTLVFDPKEPEGAYTLDLSNPGHRQVAVELYKLANEQGQLQIRGTMLDEKRFKASDPEQLPTHGTFSLRVTATKPSNYIDTPLSEEDFKSRWLDMVAPEHVHHKDPYATASACKALSAMFHKGASPRMTPASSSASPWSASTSPSRPGTAPSVPLPARPTPFPASAASSSYPNHSSPEQQPRGAPVQNSPTRSAHSSLLPAMHGQHAGSRRQPGSFSDAECGAEGPRGQEESSTQRKSVRMDASLGALGLSHSPNPTMHDKEGGLLGGTASQGRLPFEEDAGGTMRQPPSPMQPPFPQTPPHLRATNDEWRMSLLEVLLADAYLTCSQLRQVVECMHEPDTRLRAALLGFGVLSDTHLLRHVLEVLEPQQAVAFRAALGPLIMYHPSNPTGAWSLRLNNPQDAMVARHLLVGFLQQHYDQLTKHPHNVCFTLLMIDGKHTDLPSDPHKLVLPTSGSLDLCFVDLRPVVAPAPAPPPTLLPPPPPSPLEAPADKQVQSQPTATYASGMRLGSAPPFRATSYRASATATAAAAAAATALPEPEAPPAHETLPFHTSEAVHKKPVLLTEPELLNKQQMDALVAALQHWKTLDPIKLVELVDTSGHMEMHEAMVALGYPVMATWAQAFVEHEIQECDGLFADGEEGDGDAATDAAELLAPSAGLPSPQGRRPSRSSQVRLGSSLRPSSDGVTMPASQFHREAMQKRTSSSSSNAFPETISSRRSRGASTPKSSRESSSRDVSPQKQAKKAIKAGKAGTESGKEGVQQNGEKKKLIKGSARGRKESKPGDANSPDTAAKPSTAATDQGLQGGLSNQASHSSLPSRSRPPARSASASPIYQSGPASSAFSSPAVRPSSALSLPNTSRPLSSHAPSPTLTQRLRGMPEAAKRPSSPGENLRMSTSGDVWGTHKQVVGLRDHAGFVEAMRMLAVSHYITCEQLMQLLALLPVVNECGVPSLGVELCTMFWARTVDRNSADLTQGGWTSVMQRLAPQQQVCLSQRLGYMNIFNRKRPAMHYCLRMFRQDEHEIAWQLFNMAINASHTCFLDFHLDGVPKKVNQGPGMWPVMRGSAATGTVPQTVCEFDFAWDHKLIAEAEAKKKNQKGKSPI